MSGLLDEVLAAHGGLERWRAVTALTVHARFGGLLRSRFPGNRMTNVSVRLQMANQHAVFHGFPRDDQQAVFDQGDVRIETGGGELIAARRDARTAFTGFSAVRRNVRWDALDAAHFAGYAWWNYLSAPLLLTRRGVTSIEGDTWPEAGERWRRLEVSFPPHIHTHSPQQTFYVDAAGLIRRHDYIAEPVGPWARAAHYCGEHRQFDGLVFPTRRRVRPTRPGGRSLPAPTLVALDIDYMHYSTFTRGVGVGPASLDVVARRSGVSRSTLYRRFPRKDELLAAVLRDTSDAVGCEIQKQVVGSTPPRRLPQHFVSPCTTFKSIHY